MSGTIRVKLKAPCGKTDSSCNVQYVSWGAGVEISRYLDLDIKLHLDLGLCSDLLFDHIGTGTSNLPVFSSPFMW